MKREITRTSELRSLIASIQRSAPNDPCVKDLVMICQRMAAAYIRAKTNAGGFDPARLGLNADDYAFDAIADLFRPLESGSYAIIKELTNAGDLSRLTSEQVEAELRLRVFNAVNRQMFRSYRDTDPGLAKLLRNIKRTLHDHLTAEMVERNGEWVVVPRRCATLLSSKPLLTPELLQAELVGRTLEMQDLRAMLAAVGAILLEQREYARIYPVMGVALLLRGVYARGMEEPEIVELSDEMTDEELGRFLRPALGRVIRRAGGRYVEKGKVTEHDLRTYAHTLFDILMEEFNAREEHSGSFFDLLVRHNPTVTREDYLEKHRIVLEYLVKLVRRELQESIKKEWESLQ